MLPLFVSLAGKTVLVVGGGPVGRRKASAAHAAGATVRLVDPAPAVAPEPAFAWVREPYRPEHLNGVCLALAAATSEVNARVAADAAARGVWVNAATDPDSGDVFLPAVVRVGGLLLAVGTGGASPALARRVRERLEAEFDSSFAEWVAVLDEMRGAALERVEDPAARRELLDGFADWPWLARLRAEGADAVRAAMRAAIAPSPR